MVGETSLRERTMRHWAMAKKAYPLVGAALFMVLLGLWLLWSRAEDSSEALRFIGAAVLSSGLVGVLLVVYLESIDRSRRAEAAAAQRTMLAREQDLAIVRDVTNYWVSHVQPAVSHFRHASTDGLTDRTGKAEFLTTEEAHEISHSSRQLRELIVNGVHFPLESAGLFNRDGGTIPGGVRASLADVLDELWDFDPRTPDDARQVSQRVSVGALSSHSELRKLQTKLRDPDDLAASD
jgi:hypothetical protein